MMIRVFALAVLLVLVHTWLVSHAGVDVLKTIWVEMFLGAVSLVLGFLTKTEAKTFTRTLKAAGQTVLDPAMLAGIGIVLLVAGSVVSSVVVMSSGHEATAVNLGAEASGASPAEERLEDAQAVARFIRFTTPFGRSFYLDVEGFERYSFELYPWVPKRVRLTQDLTVAPTVLFRVPIDKHSQLQGGSIRLSHAGKQLVAAATSAECASLLVGPGAHVPGEFVDRWERQVRGAAVDTATLSRALEAWENAGTAKPTFALRAGMVIDGEFRTRAKATALRQYTVGTDAFQDVLLRVVKEGP